MASATTSLGTVLGRAYQGVEEFLGIPYAEAPVGTLRFAQANLWTTAFPNGTWDATKFGAPCHQSTGYPDTEPFEHPQTEPAVPSPSEDCLNLNIWRPAGRPLTPLP